MKYKELEKLKNELEAFIEKMNAEKDLIFKKIEELYNEDKVKAYKSEYLKQIKESEDLLNSIEKDLLVFQN